MRDLCLAGIPLSVQVGAQKVNPELLQSLNAGAGDRVKSLAVQERQHLFPNQTSSNKPPDAPVENPFIALGLIEHEKGVQLPVGNVNRICHKIEDGLVLRVGQTD